MITARATGDDGTQVILLGITRMNVEYLIAGKPIHVTAATHPGFPAQLAITILFGETERAITLALKPLIGDSTKIIATPRDPSGQVS